MITCIAYVIILICAAIYDLWSFRIPNVLPIALALLFLLAALPHAAAVDWASHLGAGALVFGLGALLFRLRVIGGGDVKLFSATALWMGMPLLLPFAVLTALFGALLVIILKLVTPPIFLILSRMPSVDPRALPQCLAAGREVPYGVAIAAGAAVLVDKIPAVLRLI